MTPRVFAVLVLAFGVFGAEAREATYARGPSRGEAKYWVPGRMQVAPGAEGKEFSLVKFVLVETGDEEVAGFERGFVEMGGFVAFSVQPLEPPTAEMSTSKAAILWKGIEVLLPGSSEGPRVLTGGGELGGVWNLNLLLEKEVFDPLWQDATRAAAAPLDAPGEARHRLVPQVAATLVYRDHREIDPGERRRFAVDEQRFRRAFAAIHEDRGGRLVLDEGTAAAVAATRALVRRGVVEGLSATHGEKASEALLHGLFSSIRRRWLEYGLETEAGSGRARLVARLRGPRETDGTALTFSPGDWVPVEQTRRLNVEIVSGACAVSTRTSHGFGRETKLSLEFLAGGDWSGARVSRVLMLYEVGVRDRILDFGKAIVRVDTFETRLEEIKSIDKQNVRLRTKVGGYWRQEDGGRERFVRVESSEWHDAQATLRRHFHFILPEDLNREDQ